MSRFLSLPLFFLLSPLLMAEPPKVETRMLKELDTITVRERDGGAVIVIASKTGIGAGELHLKEGAWPRQVKLRFEYVEGLGNGFKLLEDFSLATERLRISGSHKQSGAIPIYFLDGEGKAGKESPPAGHLRVTFAPVDGAMEVTLPSNLLTGSRHVKLTWIDAYRN